jgi:hypothetical protein
MSFTLSHVIKGARKAPELLSSETAAYIVLSVAEQTMGAPREVTADSVMLHASGALVVADVPQCGAQTADECLRDLLAALLESVAGPTVSDALRHVAFGVAKGPVALRSELHAALVPLNRSAARRALTRLHRRLNTLFSDSVLTLSDTSASVVRRGRRRSPLESAVESTAAEEFQISVDLAELEPSQSAERFDSVEGVQTHWHPAQPTPWQFNEASRSPGEGTPILGSLAVQERRASTVRLSELAESIPSAAVSLLATDQPLELGNSPDQNAIRHDRAACAATELPAAVEHDTQVDHPVVNKSNVMAPPLRRVSSRRSRVSDLVQRLSSVKPEPERAVAELYQMATHTESEFGALGTATPPPVARESFIPLPVASKPKPRRVLLKASLVIAPAIAFWMMQATRPTVTLQEPTQAAAPGECSATVRVSVPAHARVFLNDQQERAEQSGPIAVFQKVSCRGQAEVTVRVPERGGSPLPDAWIRVPLPEADLVRAASQSRALEVAPLAP